jgi:predicted nucleic acid-binding protein
VILVLDSSALITLARVGRLDLLRQIAGTAHIPEAVFEEVVMRDDGYLLYLFP